MDERILITGGAGFIGSHTCLLLLEAGYHLVVIDNFSNSSSKALTAVAALAELESERHNRLQIVPGDIRSPRDLDQCFSAGPIAAVVHFAGLKAVGESMQHPLRYWGVNVGGSLSLLDAMQRHHCYRLVFSSSCTVYGNPSHTPISETAPIQPINPYGQTKACVEQILNNLSRQQEQPWRTATLRYFNPVGAHPSGLIGEDPSGLPNNLFPYLLQVAIGRRPQLQIFGDDWPTPDGSCIRDYIHVLDLAEGHVAALNSLLDGRHQHLTLNLGTGRGHSVKEVLQAMEAAIGRRIPHQVVDRRPGDAAVTVGDPELAARLIGWRSRRDLSSMCRDAWAFQQHHPLGYDGA